MKYYVLKINNKLVRKLDITQDRDYGGMGYVDMWCAFTDDINLACKVTKEEIMNNQGYVKYAKMYFDDFSTVNREETIEDYDFVEVDL